jgi:hypothetical protein
MPRLTVSFALLIAVCATAHAQEMITPDKVTADPMLDMGHEDSIMCGVHWANFVATGHGIKAYEVRIAGFGIPKTKQFISIASGSLQTTQVLPNGNAGDHTNTKPADLFLFIEGDPETYKLIPSDGVPPNSTGGIVDAGGSGDKAAALALAVLQRKPIMVNYVFDRPDLRMGKETLIFRVINNMPEDKQSALADCFVRLDSRMKASDQSAK